MQQPLFQLINAIYHDIYAVEKSLSLMGEGEDYRPRIEYFHDAVRLLSSGATRSSRLGVEFLAYDIAMLRHIQANPLLRPKNESKNLSSNVNLALLNAQQISAGAAQSSAKSALSEAYKKYAVIFSALFAAKAENDYQERVEECNNEVENIALVQNLIRKKIRQNEAVNILEMVNNYVDDPDIRQKILAAFTGKNNRISAKDADGKITESIKESDKRRAALEKAHFQYVTSQLAIYENSKDIVKKMAVGGMNIVGSFVEDALRTTGGSEKAGKNVSKFRKYFGRSKPRIDARLYYAALVVSLTLPEICKGLTFQRTQSVTGKHYKEFIRTYTTENELGLNNEQCYCLRGGMIHKGNAAAHQHFNSTHVIFTIPESERSANGFSIIVPDASEGSAAMLDL